MFRCWGLKFKVVVMGVAVAVRRLDEGLELNSWYDDVGCGEGG